MKMYLGISNVIWTLVIFAMIARIESAIVLDIIGNVHRGIIQEGADIKTPILDIVVPIVGSQCSTVKKIFGVDYDRVNSSEPDVSKLNILYITKGYQYLYYLPTLAENLPRMPELELNSVIYIFIHGFTDDPSKDNFGLINSAFRSVGISNIFALDASSLIRYFYLYASTIVRVIGNILGSAFAAFVKITHFDPSNIHCIGHSLGAHICAFAGKTFHELTGLKFGRVTGLDPAGPCFSDLEENLRLFKTDATFVDAIHTDAGVYGINEDVGQVDFYVNGGSQQPGCFFETCSHGIVNEYFAESVFNYDAFQALSCPSEKEFEKGNCENNTVSYMGLGATPGLTGRYYLQTNEFQPYGASAKGLKYENRDGIVGTITGFFG